MKKQLLFLLFVGLTLGLVGCAKFGDSEKQYKSQSVTYDGKFKIESVADEVTYNTSDHYDTLIVTFKVTNLGQEEALLSAAANINAKQGEKSLGYSQIRDNDGNLIYTLNANEKIAPGKTKELKGAWMLKDAKKDVVIEFKDWGTTNSVGSMTFKTDGRETKEHSDYAKEQESVLAEKKTIKETSMKAVDIKVIGDWYLDYSSENMVKVRKDKEDSYSYVLIENSSVWSSAKKWCKSMNKNMGGKCKKDRVKINGTTYIRLKITDTQFMLFTDVKKGKTVRIYGVFTNYDELKAVVENIKIK